MWITNFPGSSVVKNPPVNAEDTDSIPGSLEKRMATHFSILAWKIPWTEESMGCKELDTTEAT